MPVRECGPVVAVAVEHGGFWVGLDWGRGSPRSWLMVAMLVLLTVPATFAQGQSPLPFRTLDRGTQSRIGEARQVTIRSATEWQDFWVEHSATRERPTVDWGREIVIGLFLGRRATGGFGVEILVTEAQGKTLTVRYRETRPEPGVLTAQVLTSPYHLVSVPAWDGEIAFEAVP